MRVTLDSGAHMPTRAHATDAGLDLRAVKGDIIWPLCSKVFDTGVHVELPTGTAGIIVSKSGLNVKKGITSTGLIDEGYQGSIKAKLYNHGLIPRIIKAGDKITQLVIVETWYPGLELVEDFGADTERGTDGFGSTGR